MTNTPESNVPTKNPIYAEREINKNIFCKNYSRKLLYLISKKGISQKILADAIDQTEASITNYVTAKRAPEYFKFFEICDYFGISADYFHPAVPSEEWKKYVVKGEPESKKAAELSAREEYVKRVSETLQKMSTPSLLKLSEFLNAVFTT